MLPGEDAKFQAEEREEYGDTLGPGDADPHLQASKINFCPRFTEGDLTC